MVGLNTTNDVFSEPALQSSFRYPRTADSEPMISNAITYDERLPTPHLRWLALAAFVLLAVPVSGAGPGHARIDSLNALERVHIFSNIETSIELYGEVAAEAVALGYDAGQARALLNQGLALYLNGQHEESVRVTLEALKIFEELDLRRELAMAYGDFGYQMKRRDMDRARSFMRRGIAIAEADRDSMTLCGLYNNFGVVQELSDLPDSADHYYRRALDYKTALRDSLAIPYALNNLSGLAAAGGRFAEAESLLSQSDIIRRATGDSYGLIVNSTQWGHLREMQGDLAGAAERYERSLLIPGIAEYGYLVIQCYERLAVIYEQLQDFESAYRNQIRFTAYRDSLFTVESTTRMSALEVEFDTERKDRLLAENRLEMATRSRQIFLLLAAVLVLVVSGISIVRYQHLKRRQLRQEMELRGQLRRAEFDERIASEKVRISRELHDNIGAQLTFMTSSIDNLAHGSGDATSRSRLDEISEFGRGTLGELRQTVWAMNNEEEGWQALTDKLHELQRQCRSGGRRLELNIENESDEPGYVSSDRLLNLFRIAQEAVQNAIKHTESQTIALRLVGSDAGFELTIRDDGPGFPADETPHIGGLSNMRERCRNSGGEFELTSDGSGTRIVCRFPTE